jgi:hypothetical protein
MALGFMSLFVGLFLRAFHARAWITYIILPLPHCFLSLAASRQTGQPALGSATAKGDWKTKKRGREVDDEKLGVGVTPPTKGKLV